MNAAQPVMLVSLYRGGICLRCGATVGDPGIHERWHDGMCDHRDAETGLRCMNAPPCNGPHRSEVSPHTWDTVPWTSPLPTV